ncbi:response regulator [Lusitaniella coriacea LEGE 07157]|uniref:Response regulator n=1 Tax=Lusitaniella coriacea LEGE 07157 TaxID=945747 RepID=A0A8J7DVP6_9CYAN|nr:response regulator [Lusitaniella coriacea]MBE9115940.1 response regulator [Lusitaniella coriacea LEGE 07157]
MSEKSILLIDDEETIQEVVKIGIEIEVDWHVAIASSGSEGINLAQTQHPDVILLDVMMPDMDGFSTVAQLKANAKTRSIPVIFLTAKTQAVEKDRCKQLGVVDVITKPFNSMTLASQIAKILHWDL